MYVSYSMQVRKLGGSATSLLENYAVLLAILIWSLHARVCNMALERLLAVFRKACPGTSCVERFVAASFLAQIQSKHLQGGGVDVRKMTRSRALATGARLRCEDGVSAKGKRARRGRRRAAVNRDLQAGLDHPSYSKQTKWVNRQLAALKRKHGRLTRGEYLIVHDNLVLRYKNNDLADVVSDSGNDECDKLLAEMRKRESSYEALVGTSLLGTSTQESPICPERLQAMSLKVAPAVTNRTSGFTERLKSFRRAFAKRLYIKDAGLIPKDLHITYEHLCGHSHPNVCKTDMVGEKSQVHTLLFSVAKDWLVGTFFVVVAEYYHTDSLEFSSQRWYRVKGVNRQHSFVVVEVKTTGRVKICLFNVLFRIDN